MSPWVWLIAGGGLCLAVMGLLWALVGRKGRADLVDVAWASLIGVLGAVYALALSGDPWRRLLAAVLIGVWAVRLASHVYSRLDADSEDPRYQELKRQWGGSAAQKMLLFYAFQAIAAFGFSVPLWVACLSPAPLGGWDVAAIIIWLIAMGGESLADWQLKQFKRKNPGSRDVCDTGLWRYSRHPNYFFEWLHWFTYVLLSWQVPLGWLTLLAPAAMYYFVVHVTGIPPTEKQSLKSRPESYRQYQKTTSAFFPWPPSRS